jgi:DNA-binding transcriptional MerR regulator
MPIRQASFDFDTEPANKPASENVAPASREKLKDLSQPTANFPKYLKEGALTGDAKKSTRGRMKLSEMSASASLIEIPDDEQLFQKSYYSIGTVSDMFKVNGSLIRFWENEFDILKPKKNSKGDRFFRPEDVKNLRLIYHLLRERKYTIEGAKEFLKNNKKADEKFALIESLKKLREFLSELKTTL